MSYLCCKIVSRLFGCIATTVHQNQSDRQTYQSGHCYSQSSVIDISETDYIQRPALQRSLPGEQTGPPKVGFNSQMGSEGLLHHYFLGGRGFLTRPITVFPYFHQFATKDENMLDLFYSNIKEAYKAAPRPHLGRSDHLSVMVIPAYKPLLIRKKLTVK